MSSPFFPPTRFGGRNRAGKLGSLGLVILAAFLLSACSNLGAWDLIARDGRSCKKRIEIDLSALAQATTLNDFPVLVELTSAWFPYSLSSSNGYDIRFSAADGSTPLQFERESWNPGGTSLFWVKVPSLAASPASTSIWIYFDSTYPEDLSDPPAVWSNGYVGVWHGSVETVGGLPAYPDSTGKNDGSAPGPYSAAQASPNGYVGGGWAFTGTKDAVVLAAASDLADLGPLTFEAWFYDSGSAVGAMLLSKGTGASGDYLGLTVKTGRSLSLTVPYGSSALTITSPASLWVASTWSDIGLSWDGSDGSAGCVFFANGASETPSGSTPGSGARVSDAGYQMVFGNTYTPPISNPISGILDEVRLSNVARSADWMKAEYLAQQGSHLSFGTVQDAPQ
ncbi:MAG TPA: DUF2341 domain-containing protein [Rectinemataceae bacterium]|nr:DUF2341 domain-containing protein [Rectinemataceae bacterium]